MDLQLNDRRVLVTGGSKGIGLEVAARFAAEGARVVVGARRPSPALNELTESAAVTFVPVDLATAEGPAELVSAAVRAHGGIDVLINNVGASEPASGALAHEDQQWHRVFDATLFSALRTMRAAVPHLSTDGAGSIVTIASLNARRPDGMIAPYAAAKAALVNLSKAVADELAPQSIRVNTISPGPVRTPLWTDPGGFAELIGAQVGASAEDVMQRVLPEMMAIPLGRVAEPTEIADLALFLASPRSSYVTGADYLVDGGMHRSVS